MEYTDFYTKEVGIFMAIGDRIKTVRGKLSRDKFAPQTGISKTTLVNYETGERNPPYDYLIRLLELSSDINPAWLLTGEGPKVKGVPEPLDVNVYQRRKPYMARKLREIRGDKSIEEFCKDIHYLSDIWWEFEENLRDPSWFLLSKLCNELGISPAWLLEDEVPMMKADVCTTEININILRDILKETEIHESINPGSLSLDKKAELIAELYKMRALKRRE